MAIYDYDAGGGGPSTSYSYTPGTAGPQYGPTNYTNTTAGNGGGFDFLDFIFGSGGAGAAASLGLGAATGGLGWLPALIGAGGSLLGQGLGMWGQSNQEKNYQTGAAQQAMMMRDAIGMMENFQFNPQMQQLATQLGNSNYQVGSVQDVNFDPVQSNVTYNNQGINDLMSDTRNLTANFQAPEFSNGGPLELGSFSVDTADGARLNQLGESILADDNEQSIRNMMARQLSANANAGAGAMAARGMLGSGADMDLQQGMMADAVMGSAQMVAQDNLARSNAAAGAFTSAGNIQNAGAGIQAQVGLGQQQNQIGAYNANTGRESAQAQAMNQFYNTQLAGQGLLTNQQQLGMDNQFRAQSAWDQMGQFNAATGLQAQGMNQQTALAMEQLGLSAYGQNSQNWQASMNNMLQQSGLDLDRLSTILQGYNNEAFSSYLYDPSSNSVRSGGKR